MFVRILNSEMELATGCTEPGAVALTAAEAGAALRKAGGTRVEAVTVRASINIIKNAMSAGIPGTSYQGMDYAAAIGAVGGDPVHLLEAMNYVPREQMEEAAALVKAGKVKVEVAQVPQKLYVEVVVTANGHTGRAVVRDLHTNVVLVEQDGVATLDSSAGNITDYIRVVQNGSNTEIQVDLDGTGGQFSPTTLVTLNGVQTDLATLLANHQLLIA